MKMIRITIIISGRIMRVGVDEKGGRERWQFHTGQLERRSGGDLGNGRSPE
jgi:hypothetical protein